MAKAKIGKTPAKPLPAIILPYTGKIKKDEVWAIEDVRKGRFILKVLADTDLGQDGFFEAEIVDGKAKFISVDAQLAQKYDGLGTPGTVMSFRTTLCNFHQRLTHE